MAAGRREPPAWLEGSTFAVCEPDGEPLGTGVLVRDDRVLTCAHVVEGLDDVEIREQPEAEVLSKARVLEPRGNPKGANDLALLALKTPFRDRTPMPFGEWKSLEDFITAGFPFGEKRDFAHGKVQGRASLFDWLQFDTTGTREVRRGFSGGVVWIPQRGVAVGIVVYRDPDSVAYAIPTRQILGFCTDLPHQPATPEVHRSSTGAELPNIGLDRIVRVTSEDGTFLGNGFRLTPKWVLTASEVASAAGSLRIEGRERDRMRGRPAEVVWPPDRSHVPSDVGVVLLETETLGAAGPFKAFVDRPPEVGAGWRSRGYLSGEASPLAQSALGGGLGPEDGGRWRLSLKEPKPELAMLDPWRGAPVFIADEADRWRLLGVLGIASSEGEWHLEARPLDPLRTWKRFDEGYREAEAAARQAAYIAKVETLLDNGGVRLAIAGVSEEWRLAAANPTKLAEHLCSETDPDDLARRLSQAYCKAGETTLAESVYSVLMWSLPASLRHRWQIELPEASSTDARLHVLERVLIEFLLAASENGAAEFRRRAESAHSELPRPTHQLRDPGELGVDLEGDDAAGELASEVSSRLVLDVGGDKESQREALGFLAEIAARRNREHEPRLIDGAVLRDLDSLRPEDATNWILKAMNRRLAAGTSAGRRLYFVVRPGEERLRRALARLLPELKIVVHQPPTELSEIDDRLSVAIDALREVFRKRALARSSTP